MTGPSERQPGAVSVKRQRPRTKPDGEVRSRWLWTEPTVWTNRMLTALENGVNGGKWHSLMDKVWSQANLFSASMSVAGNAGAAGVDHVTIAAFSRHLDENLQRLERALRDDTYRPQAVRRVYIPKPGSRQRRPLGIPTVRDRVAQAALRNVLEPIFERDFAEQSYGFRPGRCCKDALRRVEQLLKEGHTHVVDVDLKSYFDTIPHDKLLARIQEKVVDGRVLRLIERFLKGGVLDGLREWTPEQGSPQGAVVSPLLSNIYLDPLDHEMAARGFQMVRYADDLVILCRSQEEAEQALAAVQTWVRTAGLLLHPEKTRLVTHEQGFDFLGYHFERGYKWPRQKSLAKLKTRLRAKTRRTSGHSLEFIVGDVNVTSRGWFEYFKHGHWTTFEPIDSWVRMRLRSILRKRHGRKGRGRGSDHQRWPNAFFTNAGLFCLSAAHASARQSSRR